MISRMTMTAVCLTALSSSAIAQGFSGGELTIDTYSFSESGNSTGVNYSGALEYAINRNVSVAGDISIYNYSLLSDDIVNVTIHSIYHLSDSTSVGGFVGQETINGSGSSFYGIEGGYEAGQFEVEGYFALYDNTDSNTVLGVSGGYQFTDQIAAIADVGRGEVGTRTLTRLSAGAEYTFAQGPSIYAEVGNVSTNTADSGFIGLGASIEFGADRGTTFNRRGVFETINPGF